MKIINNNINFKGYKNFLGCDIPLPEKNSSFTSINLQLNNEGARDLDAYRELRRLMGYKGEELNNDVIHCVYSELPAGKFFFVNGKSLYNDEGLKELSRQCEAKDFIKEEKAHIKAYTLLASLTRRIINNGLVHRDSGMYKVIENSFNVFKEMFGNDPKIGSDFVQVCALTEQKPDKIAIKINRVIDKAMRNYFK